jgi:hypothetical protein
MMMMMMMLCSRVLASHLHVILQCTFVKNVFQCMRGYIVRLIGLSAVSVCIAGMACLHWQCSNSASTWRPVKGWAASGMLLARQEWLQAYFKDMLIIRRRTASNHGMHLQARSWCG